MSRTDIRWPGWQIFSTHQTEAECPIPDGRCVRLTSVNSAMLPSAGSDVDGVTAILEGGGRKPPVWFGVFPATTGWTVQVESGGSFSNGVLLETLSDGRVVARSSGVGVLRALEGAAGAGQLVWAVFTSGR